MSYFSSVEVYAKEYFHSLNPIAQRISSDVAATRDAYEDLWITLSYKDQRQVLDETIIHPEAVLKYSFYPQNEPEVEYFPRLRLQTGEKYIVDDEGGKGNGYTWRDEHSAPFSFMTRSQLNLNFSPEDNTKKKPVDGSPPKPKSTPKKPAAPEGFIDPPSIVLGGSTSKLASALSPRLKFPPKTPDEGNLLTKLKNKTAVLKIQSIKSVVAKTTTDGSRKGTSAEKESLVQPKTVGFVLPSTKISKPSGKVSKPKTPPPPPPKQKSEPQSCRTDPERKALLEESPADEIDVTTHKFKEEPAIMASKPPAPAVPSKPPAPVIPSKVPTPVMTSKLTAAINASKSAAEEANQSLESLQEFHSALNSPVEEVPKTGFDFLDNW